jgi:hypothetical protein
MNAPQADGPGFPADIFTEPEPDVDTLANLGPLRALAGVWTGTGGLDVHPAADGTEDDAFVERFELQPTDPQTNGPQLYYGLRYHTRIVRPGEVETFHDQVGYWLWEPATGTILQTVAIPRGQTALAIGHAAPDATTFELVARRGSTVNGILSNPFLEHAFRTLEYRVRVTVHADGTWSYDEDTLLEVHGRPEPFHHTDRNTLTRIGPAVPNPLARTARS